MLTSHATTLLFLQVQTDHRLVEATSHSKETTKEQTELDVLQRPYNVMRKELDKLAEQASVDGGGTLRVSERAECSSPVAVEDERPPSGIESVVSLESAA